jgi:hypothetical protein
VSREACAILQARAGGWLIGDPDPMNLSLSKLGKPDPEPPSIAKYRSLAPFWPRAGGWLIGDPDPMNQPFQGDSTSLFLASE